MLSLPPAAAKASAPFNILDLEGLIAKSLGGDRVTVTDMAVRAGTGVGLGFEPEVQADFATGRLQPLLQSYWARFPGFYLYHPSRLQMPRKLRAFIDFLTPRLNAKAARSAVG